jgi:hypothetical protein
MKRELSKAQERALLRWHLVRERVSKSHWSVYVNLIDKGYLRTATGAEVHATGALVVTDKGKAYCDAFHKEIAL